MTAKVANRWSRQILAQQQICRRNQRFPAVEPMSFHPDRQGTSIAAQFPLNDIVPRSLLQSLPELELDFVVLPEVQAGPVDLEVYLVSKEAELALLGVPTV